MEYSVSKVALDRKGIADWYLAVDGEVSADCNRQIIALGEGSCRKKKKEDEDKKIVFQHAHLDAFSSSGVALQLWCHFVVAAEDERHLF